MPPVAGRNSLDAAVAANDIEALKGLLGTATAGAMNIDALNLRGFTALHEAADRGYQEAAQVLIAAGANVNGRNAANVAPLHVASARGNAEIVELLIDHGAKVYAPSKESTPLHLAAKAGHREIAEILIRRGADVNTEDPKGLAPLDLAAANGRTDIVRLLLMSGANVSHVHRDSAWTALHYAVNYGRKEAVEALIDGGAVANVDSGKAGPLLYLAAQGGHREIAQVLIKHGCDVSATFNGYCALHAVAERGHNGVVELLLANGANINAPDKNGQSPLFFAFWNGHPDTVDLLLSLGAEKWPGFDRHRWFHSQACDKCRTPVSRFSLTCPKCKKTLLSERGGIAAAVTAISFAVVTAWFLFVNARHLAVAGATGPRTIIVILGGTLFAGCVGGYVSGLLSTLWGWRVAAVPAIAALAVAVYVLFTQIEAWQAIGYLALTVAVLLLLGFALSLYYRVKG